MTLLQNVSSQNIAEFLPVEARKISLETWESYIIVFMQAVVSNRVIQMWFKTGTQTSINMLHTDNAFTFDIFPNPGNNKINIDFNISEPGKVSCCVYSSAGKLEKKLLSELVFSAQSQSSFDLTDLNCGIYLCRFICSAGTLVRKLVVCK